MQTRGGGRGILYTVDADVVQFKHYGNQYRDFSKNLNFIYPMIQLYHSQISAQGLEVNNYNYDICTSVLMEGPFTVTKS